MLKKTTSIGTKKYTSIIKQIRHRLPRQWEQCDTTVLYLLTQQFILPMLLGSSGGILTRDRASNFKSILPRSFPLIFVIFSIFQHFLGPVFTHISCLDDFVVQGKSTIAFSLMLRSRINVTLLRASFFFLSEPLQDFT